MVFKIGLFYLKFDNWMYVYTFYVTNYELVSPLLLVLNTLMQFNITDNEIWAFVI